MATTALYPVTMSDDPATTAAFYRALLGLQPTYESDWYISLAAPAEDPSSPRSPATTTASRRVRAAPRGTLVTVEVDDARAIRRRAEELGAPLELELRDEPFGQRHFMVRDPDGLLVDVVQPIAPAPEFAELYVR
jgi:catechol 2,3-dioxygenase-like lactoylglutathione lyase family enzyme